MASLTAPRNTCRNLHTSKPVEIHMAAKAVMFDTDAFELLRQEQPWAADAIINQMNCSAPKLLQALRRHYFATLEVFRLEVVQSQQYHDWHLMLTDDAIEALSSVLDVSTMSWGQRHLILKGASALEGMERDAAKAAGSRQPKNNRSKGKKGSRRKQPALQIVSDDKKPAATSLSKEQKKAMAAQVAS